jgi:integrase
MEKLTELTMPRVKEFVDDVTRATSRKNARRVLFSLRTVLKLAEENGKVAQNVAIHVKVKMKKQDLEPGKIGIDRGVPTPEEAARLLAGARPEFRPMLMTAVFTGMRWGELRALTWDDVDFKRHVIVVKQAADQLGNIKKPKTEAGTRGLRMSPELEKRLREHKLSCPRTGGLAGFNTTEEKVLQIARIIEEHKAYGEHLGRPGAPRDENGRFARVGERDWHGRLLPSGNLTQRDLAKLVGVNQSAVIRVRKALREGLPLTPAGRLHFVFPTRDGGMRSHGSVTWELRKLQREIGMVDVSDRPKFVPHRMRHWFASWCIAQGWPAKVLQAYLGHATIGETFDTYGHLFADPEGDQERLAKSDAAFPFLTVIEGGGAGTKNG